ncbi:hypothetical protein C7B82_25340 [Stenomitos frigidus ULC18]|uniref:Uncharacterized protein n=1 Tax=Stenomitos frigidus ULC18 TaxID=2107698 RepID=A0A2T1DW93_9CYAN|nr:hypothetical protein C7B82_25340 [Stenomitos frigidus ULC18]
MHTLAYFYNLAPLKVDQFLLATDISEIHESSLQFCYFDEALRGIFNQEFGEPVIGIDEVCWFHLTRTRLDSKFQAGILPLGSAIKEIWNTLLEIFEGTDHYDNLLQLRDCGVADHLYNLKVSDHCHWGPFAMLIREEAFRANEVGNHDYLRLPEIIEDICNGYSKVFNFRLHDTVVGSLQPCIVKFVSNKYIGNELFKPILYYLFLTAKGEPLEIESDACFDGEGLEVPVESILKVDFLQ